MPKVCVVAASDFQYDEELGVRQGQVFQLAGHRNDQLLIKHRLVFLLDPQPKKANLETMPVCGECGRVFTEDWQRDRCGQMHEIPDAARLREAHERARSTVAERVIQVGA